MLNKLKIQNYVLIDNIKIDFTKGLNIITGETGAGKSVLLGALAVLLGQRADFSVIKDRERKCIIEGELNFINAAIEQFFDIHDIDKETPIIIRREISNNGRSRAFINDVPVKLKDLEAFALLAFDFHSQHQNLIIKEEAFRLQLIDNIAANKTEKEMYSKAYQLYEAQKNSLAKKKAENKKIAQEVDFYQFQFEHLHQAQLVSGELEELEQEYETLNHAEEIKKALSGTFSVLSDDEQSVSSLLYEAEQQLKGIQKFYKYSDELIERIASNLIDLQDIASEIESKSESISYEPERLTYIDERLGLLNELLRKHKVESIDELIAIQQELDRKLQTFDNFDFEIQEAEAALKKQYKELVKAARTLSESRKKVQKTIALQIGDTLMKLGMPKAEFEIKINELEDFTSTGKDEILFLFSANKGIPKEDISKVASGGEISRLMLALKHLLSQSVGLSTLILDEIDTGVSGEVANKMGKLMLEMAQNRQLITITHLPQIAAQGESHFKVYKQENKQSTITQIKQLSRSERETAIAELLSGENISQAALKNAKELLKGAERIV